ncbi:MAG TPA: C cytochrome precursor [Planctomycetaceae bacterium]|nr:C cytochrome precursor [Planctomycetaceae bacterium]
MRSRKQVVTQSKLLSAFVLFAIAVVVFVSARWAGQIFRTGLSGRGEQAAAGIDAPAVSAEDTPPLIEQPLDSLPVEIAATGMRRVLNPDSGATVFMHPESPCWLEVPSGGETGSSTGDAGKQTTSDSSAFVGPEACAECHAAKHKSFIDTAHYAASSLPSAGKMLGDYDGAGRFMKTVHPDLAFEMKKIGSDYFQEVQFRELRKRFKIDLVTGAGLIGQTHLYWQANRLFQLHVTYFSEPDSWVNSPGFHDGTAWYSREVIPKCLQCHATYAETLPEAINAYDPKSLIPGVTCERCHGAGLQHAEYHREHPEEKEAKFIANPSQLRPEQTNDICAQCHFGSGELIADPFTFAPGDSILDHWDIDSEAAKTGGVHSSNQLQRMKLSKCFTASQETMTCITCHNPHQNQRGDLKLYSQKCITCHQPADCGSFEVIGESIADNCIDCHMPKREDKHLDFSKGGQVQFPLLRDHLIRLPE